MRHNPAIFIIVLALLIGCGGKDPASSKQPTDVTVKITRPEYSATVSDQTAKQS